MYVTIIMYYYVFNYYYVLLRLIIDYIYII